ncbi:hypothetical protein QYS48_32445 [Marivirga arenosa]|uniref:Uncharacterized protein n=2 Tax=Marivirga arenosa TaxID=3059076 RepID=A0AA51R894_9BACT|nr:hypothetical protein [Marivirga sp. ABR2-2]WMN06396.1 hypothetical protein QYS48_32445 [Marivirga sp. ABR2-2]
MLPVLHGLETAVACELQILFIWDIYKIEIEKPDLIILPNAKGHHMYFEIAKYAYQSDIKVFALESEGNFRTDGSFPYWGYNKDQFFYQDWVTAWSPRTLKYIKNIAPAEQKDKVVLTGATGFDRYVFGKFISKNEFLKKYNKEKYSKIIGYAGWAFGKIHSAHKKEALTHIFPDDIQKRYEWVEKYRLFVRNILKQAIENNPDVLFLFKRHPKEAFESDLSEGPNEMNELLNYDNVLYFRQDEQIHDLINVSDFWMGFETTTALEAWMLGKQTILINDDTDFPRNNLHIGSPKISSYPKLQEIINEYYKKQDIEIFNQPEFKKNRELLVSDTIGYADGKNHLRVLYFLLKTFDSIEPGHSQPKLNLRALRLYFLMHMGKYFYNKSIFEKLPYFRKTIYVFESMYLSGLKERRKEVRSDIDNFYKKHHIKEKLKARDWESILSLNFLKQT